jgi:hypothetical protein
LGDVTGNAVHILQGQAVSWTVGVTVAGASGFTLSSSRIIHIPAAGYFEMPSTAFPDLKTYTLDPKMHDTSSINGTDSSNVSRSGSVNSIVALHAVWSVRRGQPGTYLICFVFSIPIAYGPLYQQEGCVDSDFFFDMLLTFSRRCYVFSVLPCAVAAVEGDTLYQIGYSHGLSYVDVLLMNTHLQARPDLLLPGDVVATGVAHQIELSCSITTLADAMLVTPQRLRYGTSSS